MESLAGTTIGGYALLASVRIGPTGETLRAKDPSGAPVVVKVLHQPLCRFTKVDAYWEEVQQVGKLGHRHIAVPEVGDWSKAGRFYMAGPWLEGVTLQQALAEHGKLPRPRPWP